jgi:hypothetical protein
MAGDPKLHPWNLAEHPFDGKHPALPHGAGQHNGRVKVVPAGARVVLAAGALVLAVVLLVGGSDPTGRLAGTVRVVGGVDTSHGVPGTVTVTDATEHTQLVRTSASGRFHVDLATGSYEVDASSPRVGDGKTPCSKRIAVSVRRGRTTHLDVVCDIR